MPSQLILPLTPRPAMARADFIVATGNAQAVAFIDSWPNWPVGVAAIFGPAGSGKTHLVSIWQAASQAHVVSAAALEDVSAASGPIAIEDADSIPPAEARDIQLFRLIEGATPASPVLLTGRETPSHWPTTLPDLASRFAAILSLPLWAPNDELLVALARKLLADRQVVVPEGVVERIVHSLERSPDSIRNFVAKADAKALSEARPISLSLVRELIAEEDKGLS